MKKPWLCPSVFPPTSRETQDLQRWLDALESGGQMVLLLATIEDTNLKFSGRKPPILELDVLQNLPADASDSVRIAAGCAQERCSNFRDGGCDVARSLPARQEATKSLPQCGIRARCLWWNQEGRAACHRCAGVKTRIFKVKP